MQSKLKKLLTLFLMLCPVLLYAQDVETITGTVTDADGEPLIGATVFDKATSNGTSTDIDGNFSIKAKIGGTLTISYIGYDSKDVKITDKHLDIKLEQNAETTLDEVVVTAMGIQRKESSLTYATQTVKGDDLMKVQDANFVNSLNGKVSGVTITQSAGGAGGTSKILLRGNKSVMGNNSPLIVVDGIPMTNEAKGSSSNWGDGSQLTYSSSSEGGDALSLINPDDIESINVLKGANAAALYGSAAANGVLMITTKKGKEGKVSITLNSNVTFDQPLSTPNLQSDYGIYFARNVATGEISQVSNTGWGKSISAFTQRDIDDIYNFNGAVLRNYVRNNVSDFLKTGTTWNNSITLSGGTEKVRSFFSYSNSHSNGMMPDNTYNRNTFSFRQNYNLFNNKLKIDVSLNYVGTKTENRPGGGTVMNPLYDLYTTPANVDLAYYKKNYVQKDGTWESLEHEYLTAAGASKKGTVMLTGPRQIWYADFTPGNNNPYWLTGMNYGVTKEHRAYGSASATYEFIPGLTAQARLNLDRTNLKGEYNRYATTMIPSSYEDYGKYGWDDWTSTDIYVDLMATYSKTFNEKYYVTASTGWVGHTNKGSKTSQWIDATSFNINSMRDKLPTLVNYFEPGAQWNGNGISWNKTSNWDKGWFLTGQVGYNDMVYLEGSYRIDWYRSFLQFSDRGTPDHYGYWSLGANTLIHRYVKMPEWVANLKVRTSYSEVGNSIPNEVYSTVTKSLQTGAATGSGYGFFENPLPENSKSFEIGFDAGLFNYNLNWDFTYYNTDLTNSYFLAATTGGKVKPVTTGSIKNQGFETTISYNILAGRDWMWKTGFNLSYNDNTIRETYTAENGTSAKMEQLIANNSIAVRYEKGGSYGDMYALDFNRNADGSIYIDPNTGRPSKSNTDWKYIGNMNSKWNLGWSNTLRWKDLTLYFLISGRIGGKFISLTEAYLDNKGMSKRSAEARKYAEEHNIMWTAADGTQKPGMNIHGSLVPVEDYYTAVGGNFFGTEYVYDATNFRLSELSISYQLNNLFHGFIKNLTISAVGRNLFFIYRDCPSDPDIALSTKNGLGAFDVFNMPSIRSYGINLKIEF